MIPTHNSWLADTTPAPRVVIDAEAGSRFTPSRKVGWDPTREAPPVADGTWDTAIVTVQNFQTVQKAYEWLASGQHPFRSVVMDSVSEVQQRCVDDISGTNQMRQQDWGQLLRVLSDLIRKFRDLVTHPTNPFDAVIFIAMTKQNGDGTWIPWMQGSMATTFPYYVDLAAYLNVVPLEDGSQVRRLFCGSFTGFETGNRLAGRVPDVIDNPNISEILAMVRGETSALPTTSSQVSMQVSLQEGVS